MIKIIGGAKKGQSIFTTEGQELRPTSAKVKEALFNILGDNIHDGNFLDLFAGCGSIGIEALSRGAKHCTFIEKNKIYFKLLKKNIDRLQYQASSILLCMDAFKFKKNEDLYDFVFIDPPYASGILEKILPVIGGSDMIKKNGIMIVEHFKKTTLEPNYGLFSLKKRYPYGDTILSLFQCQNE